MLEVRDDRFPLVIMEIRDAFTMDDADAVFGYMAEQIQKERKFAIAIRVDGVGVPSTSTLKHAAQWIAENRTGVSAFNVCIGIHLESAALRGALRFLNTLSAPASPQESFPTWEETEAWTTEQLEAAGLGAG